MGTNPFEKAENQRNTNPGLYSVGKTGFGKWSSQEHPRIHAGSIRTTSKFVKSAHGSKPTSTLGAAGATVRQDSQLQARGREGEYDEVAWISRKGNTVPRSLE